MMDQRGFTLVELLVAVAVMLVVTGAVFAVLDPARGAFQVQPEAADLQQRLRVAADAVALDLRTAGAGSSTGASTGTLARFLPSVFPYRVGLVSPDTPGAATSDTITLVRASAGFAQATLRDATTTDAASVSIATPPGCPVAGGTCGFEAGMLALLYDETGAWDLFSVAAVEGGVLTKRAGSRGLSKDYQAGAEIVQVDVAAYAVKAERGTLIPQLRRYDGDQSEQPLVDHIVALEIEYFGDPQPPMLDAGLADARGPLTTYGPRPPPLGVVSAGTGYPAGENCVFRVDAGVQRPRLPALAEGSTGLVALDPVMFTDGPWCPGPDASNRYDADLLRVRQVRVALRAQAAADWLRGADRRLFANPGSSTNGQRWLPDRQIRFDVVPRNLNLGR
jgi:prepilin-type N-terminal cleavage/methylation domain-containing protein